jgi:DNA-binding transcriptional ArsR family regulator
VDTSAPGGRRRDLLTVRDPGQAAALLQPQRLRLLGGLGGPDSAAGLARRFGLPRQQVNYHLRELERAGLVELVEERRRGNCVERVMVATARRVVISPEVLGGLDVGGDVVRDRFSPSALVGVAARAIRELAELERETGEEGGRPATLTLESEVRFADLAARNAFAKELSDAVAHLVVKYHDAAATESPAFRVVVAAYPSPARPIGRDRERDTDHG